MSRAQPLRDVVAGAVGAAAAIAVDRAVDQTMPSFRTESAAAGLITAAVIYPLARRRGFGNLGEKAVLALATGIVVAAAAKPNRRTELIAAGWIAHAAFDGAFRPNREVSRIPGWYPAMCAGYDVALGARLLLPRRGAVTVRPTSDS
jgi:hypothetical protein